MNNIHETEEIQNLHSHNKYPISLQIHTHTLIENLFYWKIHIFMKKILLLQKNILLISLYFFVSRNERSEIVHKLVIENLRNSNL